MSLVQSFERLSAIALAVAMGLSSLSVARAADAPATPPAETKEQRDARMAWWREARFGMFIHWGIYSVPAGVYKGKQIQHIGEWIMNDAEIPMAEYAGYARDFNPVDFNADEWVSIAKNAGMKYIVITSKHHDGFAMFHSKTSPYNIYDATPFKRDPLAELAEACKKQGIKLGFYYSQAQDWGHPGGAAARKNNRQTDHWDPAQDGDFDQYLKTIALPQVREILTNYGPVSVLWFDTPVNMTHERALPFLAALHELQPNIIVNNRLVRNDPEILGDTETPEQFIPPGGFPGRDWETCMTMNDTWGYKSWDNNFKAVDVLLHNLIDIASKGGNYLLNVGPTAQGKIPQPEVDRLGAVGEWLKTNGDAIYGSSASPFRRQLPFGRVTQKEGKLYLSVFDWPKDGTIWLPLTSKISKAYLLTSPDKTFEIGNSEGGSTIKLTGDAPDKIASVVVAELDGPPQTFVPPIRPGSDGVYDLDAVDADLAGSAKLVTRRGHKQAVALMKDQNTANWQVGVIRAGDYKVDVTYSAEAGAECVISVGDQKVSGKFDATKSADDFTTVTIGKLSLDKPGEVTITAAPAAGSSINIKALKLTPQ